MIGEYPSVWARPSADLPSSSFALTLARQAATTGRRRCNRFLPPASGPLRDRRLSHLDQIHWPRERRRCASGPFRTRTSALSGLQRRWCLWAAEVRPPHSAAVTCTNARKTVSQGQGWRNNRFAMKARRSNWPTHRSNARCCSASNRTGDRWEEAKSIFGGLPATARPSRRPFRGSSCSCPRGIPGGRGWWSLR